MQVRITNVYNDNFMTKKTFAAINGVSYHISINDEQILFDTGLIYWRFKRNLRYLGIQPDEINKIVISHGHMDHTRGLKFFIRERSKREKVTLFAHPDVREPKRAFYHGIKLWNAGFPKLTPDMEKKVDFRYSKEPMEIAPKLFTSGETPLQERVDMQNLGRLYYHQVGGKWEHDPLIDEISLVLQTKDGIVLISGCGHVGLLNILRKVENLFKEKVIIFIGGIHLVFADKKKVLDLAVSIKQKYGNIKFYLNHSIGTRAFRLLSKNLEKETVKHFSVGNRLVFNC